MECECSACFIREGERGGEAGNGITGIRMDDKTKGGRRGRSECK